jgi:branched-chain amino acid aminotransferase
MTEPVAYLNGDFIPESQLVISTEDLGFAQGVSISERLRTFRGELFRLDDHLDRLANSLRIVDLRLELSIARLGELAAELVERNRQLLTEGDDLGVSLLITPGVPARQRSTVGMRAYPLPFGQWTSYHDRGQSLFETGVRQVPQACWPSALKCRSRMHYYLADRLAHSLDPGSRAILLDLEGYVSEASTANVLFYRHDEGLVSPPREMILPGVSLSVLAELAAGLGLPFCFRRFSLDELAAADEILMCSTSPCVWPVTRLNGQARGPGAEGPVYRQVLQAWSALVGVDIAAQARQFAFRK